MVDFEKTLKHYAEQYCEGWCKDAPAATIFFDCGGCLARFTLWEAKQPTHVDLDKLDKNMAVQLSESVQRNTRMVNRLIKLSTMIKTCAFINPAYIMEALDKIVKDEAPKIDVG